MVFGEVSIPMNGRWPAPGVLAVWADTIQPMGRISETQRKELSRWEIKAHPSPSVVEVETLRRVINASVDERPIQDHLAANPRLFSPLLGGGHGRWVRPKVRLGDRFETDFMVADADSTGFHWLYVELESPKADIFLKSGELAEKARHGIHQIHEWRNYIEQNGSEARRLREEGGLGLPQIGRSDWGLVLIGRTETIGEDPAERRRQLESDERILVHTYDWLLDQLEAVALDPAWDHLWGGAVPYTDVERQVHLEETHAALASEPGTLPPRELPGWAEPPDFDPFADGN
jgi:hypothetical protein